MTSLVKFNKPKELIEYLKNEFGIELPKEVEITKTKDHGMRVHVTSVHATKVWGIKGFTAYSKRDGINNWFIQLIGHLAKKNVIALTKEEAIEYAAGGFFRKKIKLKRGYYILSYKGHILGLGRSEGNGIIRSRVRKKRKKIIQNDIKPYPGRNM